MRVRPNGVEEHNRPQAATLLRARHGSSLYLFAAPFDPDRSSSRSIEELGQPPGVGLGRGGARFERSSVGVGPL